MTDLLKKWGAMMAEYIDRKALGIGKCNPDIFEDKGYANGWNSAIKNIEEAPTVDVVEVVRCKDCKYYRNHPNGLCYAHTEPYGTGYKGEAICVEPDDFCSYGERKDVQE